MMRIVQNARFAWTISDIRIVTDAHGVESGLIGDHGTEEMTNEEAEMKEEKLRELEIIVGVLIIICFILSRL